VSGKPKDSYLITVLVLSAILGVVVAIAVYFGWTSGVILPGLNHPLTALSLALCPGFILSLMVAPAPDSALALGLVLGTIVFANIFLYAGFAAGMYFIVGTMVKHRQAKGGSRVAL
jgi:hypothetical protein